MGRLEELRYIYHTRRPQMDQKMLYEFIDLLVESHDNLIETMEDISNKQDRDLDNEDREPRYSREDMD